MLVDNFAKLGSSTRKATSVSLIVIAVYAMYNWMVTPHSNYLSAARGYESAVDMVIEQNNTIVKQVETKRKQLQELRENSTQLQSVLFASDQAREFFSDLQVISEQAGCVVNSINLVTKKTNPENERLGIVAKSAALNIVGVYSDIAKLIERLQTRTQKVWIDSIRMKTLDSNSDKVICDLTITICQITDKDIP
jgi:Tfp pilus assembly protein PilO